VHGNTRQLGASIRLRAGTILVVCAERGGALDGLLRWLANSGIDCIRRSPAQCSAAWVTTLRPALVVIDAAWTLSPAAVGAPPFNLVTTLRAACRAPLVCVTAGRLPDVDLLALDAGCDQVWHVDEPAWLMARRCLACLRQAGTTDKAESHLTVSARDGLLRAGNRRVPLSPGQLSALDRLLRAAPDTVARTALAMVAFDNAVPGPQTLRRVDTMIARLRSRLRRAQLCELKIVAVRHLGYRIEHGDSG
jgi:DNA-binding response OmpR family regulator